ncbi:Mcat [Symbiodinium sp. CCMP2592]|nr:Mcat [Symbiodinium sp. CCMP2592]
MSSLSLTGIRTFAAHVNLVMLVEGVRIEDARKPFRGLFLEELNQDILLDCAKATDLRGLGCFCASRAAEKEGVLHHLRDEEVKIAGLAGRRGAAEGGRNCDSPPGMMTGEDAQSSVGQTLAGGAVSGPEAATTADRLQIGIPDARTGAAMCVAGTLTQCPGIRPERVQGRSCRCDEEAKEGVQAAQTIPVTWKGGDPLVNRTGRGSGRAAGRGAEKGRTARRRRTSPARFGRSRPRSIRPLAPTGSAGMQVPLMILPASGRTPRLKRPRRLIPSKRLRSLPLDLPCDRR